MSLRQAINNDVISMRPFIRKARVHVIHKLTKEIKLLRQKKGTDQQREKYTKKADRYAEEILILKKLKNDEITKQILKEKRSSNEILNCPQATLTDKAVAKIQANKFVDEHIKTLQAKYPAVLDKLLRPTKKQLAKKKVKTKDKKKIKTKQNIRLTNKKIKSNNLGNISISNNEEIKQDKSTLKIEFDNKNIGSKNINEIEQDNSILKIKNQNNIENKPKRTTKRKELESTPPKKINKIAEVKPFFEFVQNETNNASVESHNGGSEINSSFEIEENVLTNVSANTKKEIDPFFVTADGESKFLITSINNEAKDKPENQNRIYNDNLNRKQRRSMKRNGKKHFAQRRSDFKPTFEKKSSITNLNIDKISDLNSNRKTDVKIEELHPSWQAKKLQRASITEFQGKKIVFDD